MREHLDKVGFPEYLLRILLNFLIEMGRINTQYGYHRILTLDMKGIRVKKICWTNRHFCLFVFSWLWMNVSSCLELVSWLPSNDRLKPKIVGQINSFCLQLLFNILSQQQWWNWNRHSQHCWEDTAFRKKFQDKIHDFAHSLQKSLFI